MSDDKTPDQGSATPGEPSGACGDGPLSAERRWARTLDALVAGAAHARVHDDDGLASAGGDVMQACLNLAMASLVRRAGKDAALRALDGIEHGRAELRLSVAITDSGTLIDGHLRSGGESVAVVDLGIYPPIPTAPH